MNRPTRVLALFLVLAVASWALPQAQAQGDPSEVVEVYSQDFYDGIAVTVEHYTDGSFQAFVTVEENDLHPVRALYYLDVQNQTGNW
jgi:hypothetical protein